MRFEKSIDIGARTQRVWAVLSDLEAWPRRIETVELVELLTPPPLGKGSRVRIKQPKLGESTWEVTVWDPSTYLELCQKSRGMTSVAGHRVEALEEDRSRLILTLDMRGFLIPVALLFKGMTNRYLTSEAQDIKHVAESPGA